MKISHIFAAVFTVTLLGACATQPEADEVEARPGLVSSFQFTMSGRTAPTPAQMQSLVLEAENHPLGSDKNPVRADSPRGQREYLGRLRCANEAAPRFHRVGSFGYGPYGSIIDGYETVCNGSEPAKSLIFMDMYFPSYRETRPVSGFTIVD